MGDLYGFQKRTELEGIFVDSLNALREDLVCQTCAALEGVGDDFRDAIRDDHACQTCTVLEGGFADIRAAKENISILPDSSDLLSNFFYHLQHLMHKDLFVGLNALFLFVGLNALFLFVRLNALKTFSPVHLLFQFTL